MILQNMQNTAKIVGKTASFLYGKIMLYSFGRRSGKALFQEQQCKKSFKLGYNVIVANIEGLFCFNCKQLWKDCGGKCKHEETENLDD